MNVLFIIEGDWLKGPTFDMHILAEAMSLFGHKVFAIDYAHMRRGEGFLNLGPLKTKEFDGVACYFSGASVCLRSPGFVRIPGLGRISAALTHYLEIARTIRENNIDVIVLNSIPTNGLQTIYLARKANIPVVFRFLDILHRVIRYHYPLAVPLIKTMEKRVYSDVDAILSLTPQFSEYLLNLGVPESKVKMLLFPVDTDFFRPSVDCSEVRQKWGFNASDQIIFFMGIQVHFSGLDEFILRFPKVTRQVPQAKLLIVGTGPQRSKLEKIIAETGQEKQVILAGFEPFQLLPQYVNLATLCINTHIVPITAKDFTFPSKIVQYMACGKAVIATALPGTMALLSGEAQGIVYVRSMDEMVGEVVSLLQSPDRRKRLESAALSHARQVYSCQSIARQLETILEQVIEAKKNGGNLTPE